MPISSQAKCFCGKELYCKGMCKSCYNKQHYKKNRSERLKKEYSRYRSDAVYREKARQRAKERNKRIYRENKALLMEALGDSCVRCGFDDKRALQFDHIHGGGVKQQGRLTWLQLQTWMLKNLDEIQVLCANCNWIKRHENNEQPPGPPRRIGND